MNKNSNEIGDQSNARLTLLCPFTQRGIVGVAYGKKFFGKSADWCEQYFIRDDPVPSCNQPISHAITFDIADAVERDNYIALPGDSDHAFPAFYYSKYIAAKGGSRVWKKAIPNIRN